MPFIQPVARAALLVLFALALPFLDPVIAAEPASGTPPAAEPVVAPAKRPANRLAKETSPYLLLHAHNPVEWYPWGEEALSKAKREKKLIFLSVGYSSCYWCHVMERESFLNDEIAALLNEHFVAIKVDREERPDIDEIYMRALQIYLQLAGAAQGGGWPLTMFLSPDGKPLAGGTYFPPADRDGRSGLPTVLKLVQKRWSDDPVQGQQTADRLAEFVRESLESRPAVVPVKLDRTLLDAVERELAGQFDPTYGGFGFDSDKPRRPKFPEPPNLVFLLDRATRTSDPAPRKMLLLTLDRMAAGGIRDQLGGGFHRYSTDRYWRVPHFEKMLYDNGQLASVYARAYELEPRAEYRHVVDELLAFVKRELTSPEGGFYTALDAETAGHEGAYYVWQRKEIEKLLTPDEFKLAAQAYGLDAEPNFEGAYILTRAQSNADLAKSLFENRPRSAGQAPIAPKAPQNVPGNVPGPDASRKGSAPNTKSLGNEEAELDARLRAVADKLLAERQKRKRPLTDTKVLAGSCGLMIRGYADAGRVFDNPDYVAAAARAADFVLANLRAKNGRLLRSYCEWQAKVPAFLDDYAFLIDGLLALHRADGNPRWLEAADRLMQDQLARFWDERAGGFYQSSTDHETLIARSKVPTDGATPSGNSVSAANLIELARTLRKPEYLDRARQTIAAVAPLIKESPTAAPQMAAALARLLDEPASKGETRP